jgi:hypothetical protein
VTVTVTVSSFVACQINEIISLVTMMAHQYVFPAEFAREDLWQIHIIYEQAVQRSLGNTAGFSTTGPENIRSQVYFHVCVYENA